eukprot:1801716-Alexandrium_andersonii.AAC.1
MTLSTPNNDRGSSYSPVKPAYSAAARTERSVLLSSVVEGAEDMAAKQGGPNLEYNLKSEAPLP